ncbi:MAG: LPS export ABC transporter protein LptC [Pseudohongiellaceae bacterium]|jgi:LPS export ABC transporter protein LptC|tara:strand:- start:3422 stop:4051 length:630 start_codon:yes stop_codon:yes gene_type:complete
MNTILSKSVRNKPELGKTNLRNHFLAIFLLSGIMYYLLDSATDEEVLDITRLLDLQSQEYDYFMANVDTVHYGADGVSDYRFQAVRVTHFPNPEYSIIEAPRFMLYGEDNAAWEINSGTGRIELDTQRNQERLELNENVIISGIAADGTPVNIYTDSLTIYPEEKSMSTQSNVLFETDGFSSTSSGINVDLNINVFRQLANGQLQYDNE